MTLSATTINKLNRSSRAAQDAVLGTLLASLEARTPVVSGVETGLTAHAGGTQAAALALSGTKSVHEVTIVATAADSVKLPLATGSGAMHYVRNSSATSLQLFGSGTDTIDAVATATGVAVAGGKTRTCVDTAAGTWISVLSA